MISAHIGDRKLFLNYTHTVHENMIIVTIKIQYIKVTVILIWHLSIYNMNGDSRDAALLCSTTK